MKAVIQRVKRAAVTVEGKIVGEIGRGYMALLGVERGDDLRHADYIAEKILKLRIFEDENGKMNLNLAAVGGDVLLVSQFTLITDIPVGNRPFFGNAEEPERADMLYRHACEKVEEGLGRPVQRGVFGAHMEVALTNDGPVTIIVDSRDKIK